MQAKQAYLIITVRLQLGKKTCVQVIVLSPDAQEPLATLEEDHVYILGGIVDCTVHKYLTAFYASCNGFQVCCWP
jgi:Trm5-related predicted tRNA methylase